MSLPTPGQIKKFRAIAYAGMGINRKIIAVYDFMMDVDGKVVCSDSNPYEGTETSITVERIPCAVSDMMAVHLSPAHSKWHEHVRDREANAERVSVPVIKDYIHYDMKTDTHVSEADVLADTKERCKSNPVSG